MPVAKTEFGKWICILICSYSNKCHELCLSLITLLWFDAGWFIHIFRVTSLALGQSFDCPSASEATLKNMGKYSLSIHCHVTTTKQSTTKTCISYMICVVCNDIKQHDAADRGAFLIIICSNAKRRTIRSNLNVPLISTQNDRDMQLEKRHVFRLYVILFLIKLIYYKQVLHSQENKNNDYAMLIIIRHYCTAPMSKLIYLNHISIILCQLKSLHNIGVCNCFLRSGVWCL